MVLGSPTSANCTRTEAIGCLGASSGINVDKENQPQAHADKENRSQAQTIKTSAAWTHEREVEQLKQRVAQEEKLRLQAEAQAGMGRTARRKSIDAQGQVQSQASEIETLKETCKDLEGKLKAAVKRAQDQEIAANFQKRMAQGKEQAMTALKKDMDIAQSDLQDLRQQLGDYDGVDLELERLRQENCTLRASLTALETNERNKDEGLELEMENLQQENSTMRAQLAAFETDDRNMHEHLELQLETLQQENCSLQEQVTAFETDQKDKDEIDNLHLQNCDLRRKLASLETAGKCYNRWGKVIQPEVETCTGETRESGVQTESDTRESGVQSPATAMKCCLPEHAIREEVDLELQHRFSMFMCDLHSLQDRTVRNEERVRAMHSRACDDASRIGSQEARILASRVVQHAVLQGLVTTKNSSDDVAHGNKEIEMLRAEVSHLRSSLHQQSQIATPSVELEEGNAMLSEQLALQEVQAHMLQQSLAEQSDVLAQVREEAVALRADKSEMATASTEFEEQIAKLSEQLALQEVQEHTLQQRLVVQSEVLSHLQEEAARLGEENDEYKLQLGGVKVDDSVEPTGETVSSHCADVQEFRVRNRELLLTVEQFKQECEILGVENRSLLESASTFAENFERVTGQQAKLMGHANHQQKIKYTMKLRDENVRLQDKIKKIQKEYLNLEASKRGSLFEALPSLCTLSQTVSSHNQSDASDVVPVKVEGLSQVQESALEAVIQDFLHLRALIERAVSDADPVDGQSNDITTLLQRLRCLVADSRRPTHEPVSTMAL